MHFSRITLSFGRHADRRDIPDLARTLKAGAYDVFIDDSPLPNGKRIENIKGINAGLDATRKRMQSGLVLPSFGGSYNDALIEAMLQTKGARYFLVEGYTEGQLSRIDLLRERRDNLSDQIFQLALSTYQVDGAVRCTKEYLNAYTDYIRARNRGIRDGFARLHEELPAMFPGIRSPLNVYARFGLTHLMIGESAIEGCQELVTLADPSRNYITDIIPRLTGNAPYTASDAEVVRAMFALLYSGFDKSMPEEAAFNAIGREMGFLSLLDEIAGTRGACDKFRQAITAASV